MGICWQDGIIIWQHSVYMYHKKIVKLQLLHISSGFDIIIVIHVSHLFFFLLWGIILTRNNFPFRMQVY